MTQKTRFTLDGSATLSVSDLVSLAQPGRTIEVNHETLERIRLCRAKLDQFVADGRIIYGVNTSVGGLVHMLVPIENASALQNNLINAVSSNVGDYFDDQTTRAAMLARINSLARGYSAISVDNFSVLVEMFNSGVIPCVPEKGSLGTSGDLGPLAAIALVATGQWKARYQGREMPGAEALAAAGIVPMRLSYKEGLALVNGTSMMVALGAIVLTGAQRLLRNYLAVSALSFEALAAKTKPFDPRVHRLKPHRGQQQVAEDLWERLKGSGLAMNEADVEEYLAAHMKGNVSAGDQQIEDAYSIRCTPQILGPVIECMAQVEGTLERELNSANDNPLIIPTEDEVFHNGHFHGQYVAAAMDHLNIALVTTCNLADRRIDRFLTSSNSNGLPAFLCRGNAGIRLGLMGGQFLAASLTAETRSLCTPISVQSLTSTGDFQDVVSLGLVAARRTREVLRNTGYVVGFELMCACEAADIRGADRLSPAGHQVYEYVRTRVGRFDQDRVLTPDLETLATVALDDELTGVLLGATRFVT